MHKYIVVSTSMHLLISFFKKNTLIETILASPSSYKGNVVI